MQYFPFPGNSSCRHALLNDLGEVDETFRGREIPLQSRIGLSRADKNAEVALKVVNSGSGTTGTHTIYDTMCEMQYRSVHFRLSCNFPKDISQSYVTKRQSLEVWHVSTTQCILSTSRKKHCLVQSILNKLRKALVDSISVAEFMTDSPLDVIFPEIVAYVSNIKVVGTYRSPKVWAKRRFKTHGHTQIICRPQIWSDKSVLHPFDLVGCLLLHPSGYATDALMTSFEYINGINFTIFKGSSEFERNLYRQQNGSDIGTLEKAYQTMNSVNMQLVHAMHMSFVPICLWDFPKRDNTALRSMLHSFIGYDPKSRNFEHRQLYDSRQVSIVGGEVFTAISSLNEVNGVVFSCFYILNVAFIVVLLRFLYGTITGRKTKCVNR
jgi:hypothetical protein